AGSRRRIVIKKEELAQAVAACELDPVVVRGGREGLFERYYESVFPTGDPDFYLSRYWLMRNVATHARGTSERTYAKWVVTNFLWSELGHELKKRSIARQFRAANENPRKYPNVHQELDRAIERAVLAAVKFYRSERRTDGAFDPSGFFNSTGRGKQFAIFWPSHANPHRKVLQR